jgi:hypothetical protein
LPLTSRLIKRRGGRAGLHLLFNGPLVPGSESMCAGLSLLVLTSRGLDHATLDNSRTRRTVFPLAELQLRLQMGRANGACEFICPRRMPSRAAACRGPRWLRGATRWVFFPIVWTRAGFGGKRPWFQCSCGKRTARLYHVSGVIACHRCQGLIYECQRRATGRHPFHQRRSWSRLLFREICSPRFCG